MRVKICGLVRPGDVATATTLGATHLGFVLVPGTPRAVTTTQVGTLVADVPDSVTCMLVFRDATAEDVLRATEQTGVRTVQLHVHDDARVSRLMAGGLRVHRVFDAETVLAGELPARDVAHPIHIDVGAGGTGRRFDWSLLQGRDLEGVFLAGGITAENVSGLFRYEPWGIDLSSGVESAPGVKDPERLRELFASVSASSGGTS